MHESVCSLMGPWRPASNGASSAALHLAFGFGAAARMADPTMNCERLGDGDPACDERLLCGPMPARLDRHRPASSLHSRLLSLATLPFMALLLCEPAHVLSAESSGHEPGIEAFAPAGTPARHAPDRVLDIEHATIHVVPDLVGQRVAGVIELRARVLDPTAREITLHAVDLTFEAATIDGQPSAIRLADEEVHLALTEHEGSQRLPGAISTIRLHWRASPRLGLYFFGPTDTAGRAKAMREGDPTPPRKGVPERVHALQAWTQGETHETRHWLPIWDYPNDRFTTSWTIAAPEDFSVIANGEAEGIGALDQLAPELQDLAREWLGSDAATWRYEQRQDHVSYLLTMVVGRFDRVALDWRGKPIEYWVPLGREAEAEASFDRTPDMLDFFSTWIGVEYPWAKYAQTAVQEFTFGGMENVSATTMTDRILHPARLEPIDSRDSLVAHELAHQWWGDLLTCRDWAHVWLNEGFAVYFTALWHEHAEGADQFALERLGMAKSYFNEATRYQRPIVTHEYRHPSTLFDRHTYPKGGWVLHMLRRELGDAAFQRAIHYYAEQHAYGLVETSDLQAAIRDTSGRNLDRFFEQWVYDAGHPRLRSSWRWDPSTRTVTISLEQLQARPFEFLLDLELGQAGGNHAQRVRVSEKTSQIVLPAELAPRYVLVDAGMHLLAELDSEQPEPAWIAQLAEAPHAIDRIRAARALGQRGGVEAIAALHRAVDADRFHGVRTEAAAALGRIGDAGAQRALLDLWELEQIRLEKRTVAGPRGPGSDARVRVALLDALAEARAPIGEQELELIVDVLKDDPIDHVRAAAAKALTRFDAGKLHGKALKQLRKALEQRSHHELVEQAAAKALGRIGTAKQLDLLLDLISDQRPTFLRLAAIDGLLDLRGREGVLDDAARERVAKAIAGLLDDPNMRIRRAVVDDLRGLALPDTRERLRRSAERDVDPRVRSLAEDQLRLL